MKDTLDIIREYNGFPTSASKDTEGSMSEHKHCPLCKMGGVNEGKQGYWEYKQDPYEFFDKIPVCSECGCTTKWRDAPDVCPHCGANMRKEEE